MKEEKRTEYIKKITSFFLDHRSEEIGVIAAGEVLDFFAEDIIAKDFYEQGIRDVKKLLKEKMEDLEMEMDLISEQ
ncbi:MAG: DUF2164 family protein [Patescibacteria group bacterium]